MPSYSVLETISCALGRELISNVAVYQDFHLFKVVEFAEILMSVHPKIVVCQVRTLMHSVSNPLGSINTVRCYY